uniref:Uncharacterized protein n=1 Tax=Asparagus officinalis TaxID=4686 RepID=Q2XNT8_ASPOF|nr:hypothetical protein 12.t00053 [Asparagus officinalis]
MKCLPRMLASSLLLVDDPNIYTHWNNCLVWLITLDEFFCDLEQATNSSNRVVQTENNSVNRPSIDEDPLQVIKIRSQQSKRSPPNSVEFVDIYREIRGRFGAMFGRCLAAIGAAFELCLAAIGAAFELCLAAIGAAFELCLAAIGAAFELIVEAAFSG